MFSEYLLWHCICIRARFKKFNAHLKRQIWRSDSFQESRLQVSTSCGVSLSMLDRANAFARYFTNRIVFCYVPLDFSSNTVWEIRKPFTLDELKVSLQNYSHCSPGNDRIPFQLIQCCDNVDLTSLLNCFNKMWGSCILPPSWRESVVVLIP